MELKPCPFCGSDNVEIHIPYMISDMYMVQCYDCNCNTAIFETPEKAAEAWNRRAENE